MRHLRIFAWLLIFIAVSRQMQQDAIAETPEESAARIERMEKVADYALVPPQVNTSPLPDMSMMTEGTEASIFSRSP